MFLIDVRRRPGQRARGFGFARRPQGVTEAVRAAAFRSRGIGDNFQRENPAQREAMEREKALEAIRREHEAEQRHTFEAEENVARAQEEREARKDRARLLSLMQKEESAFRENRAAIESIESEITKVINPREAKLSGAFVRRLAINIDYMLRTTKGIERMPPAQKMQLAREVALGMAMNIVRNPAVRSALRKSPLELNSMVRETFSQLIEQQ